MVSGPPSQSYKISAHGEAGGGSRGRGIENLSGASVAAGSGRTASTSPTAASSTAGQQEPKNANHQPTVQEEMGAALPADFTLANTRADGKGQENTVLNPMARKEHEGEALQTGGRGGDLVREGIQAHEICMPANKPHLHRQANERSDPPVYDTITDKGLESADLS